MKYFILNLLLVSCITSAVRAQMDDKFYFPGKTMLPIDSLNYEEVLLPADSAQVSGIFIKPAGKPKATILLFHGAGGNVTSYTFMIKPLVRNGYQVFMADFRGYGKSTGKPTHLNIAHDGQLILDYLLQRKEVKGSRLIIYGASMGTQIAAKLARENQYKLSALVLDGTISSFTDIAADKSPENQREMIRQYLPSPYSAKEDIKSVNIPVLFIHSREDQDVPFQEAELVYNNAQGPKEMYIYKGRHLEAMKSDSQEIVKRINKLINVK